MTLSKFFLVSSESGSILKGKKCTSAEQILSKGSKFSLFRVDPFLKEVGAYESKHEATKVVSLAKVAEFDIYAHQNVTWLLKLFLLEWPPFEKGGFECSPFDVCIQISSS